MAGDFDVSDADYEADVTEVVRNALNLRLNFYRMADKPHPPTEVEGAIRDPQPARLTLGEP